MSQSFESQPDPKRSIRLRGEAEPSASGLPAHDMSALLLHLQRTAGNRAVNGLLQRWASTAPVQVWRKEEMPEAVQREPQPGAGAPTPARPDPAALTVGTGSQKVVAALGYVFENQKTGLERLGKALQKNKPSNDLLAMLGAAAVGAALAAVLGPVGPAAEALVSAEDEVGRALVKKGADLVKDKAIEKAKEGVRDFIKDARNKKTDPIDNFIESQALGLNRAHEAAVQAFLDTADGFTALPGGPTVLKALTQAIDAQAQLAESLQIAHSAGAWAGLIAAPGDDAKAWANKDQENYAEKGALEIEASVAGPIKDAGDLQITGSNWRGINKETERVLQEHGGATLRDLAVNLRITLTTPVGETLCEIPFARQGDPIIPEKSTLQGVMAWLITGKMNPALLEEDRMTVVSGAALLGSYMLQKPVAELHFD